VVHALIVRPTISFTNNMAMKITIRPGGTGLCPMCREAISKQALKCPHCHSDLSQNQDWLAAAKNGSGCAPLIMFIGAVFAGAYYLISQHS